MGKIQQLSPHVADLIAAGEVVERPASAAKELVENAIDAGATRITVELQEGGMRYLRVTDNGCGMSPEDACTAFLRHATSKLREASQLEAISTLGFRGEALAAISAVSRVDLLTRTPESDFGTSVHLEAGTVTEQSEAGCPVGTTIIVRDLFYNTPARMKFMKRDSVEAAALLSTVQRLALAHPEIAFHVLRDGEEQLRTVGDGELRSAIFAVLGKTTGKEMLPMKSAWDSYSLSGFLSTPIASRGNRGNEIFFVNGRFVRSKTMTAALEEAYRNRIMVGRFPSCVLHLHLPEHLVDVNVHPAKTEVKFLNEKDVFDCIHYGVKGALDAADGRVELRMKNTPSAAETRAAPRGDFYRNMNAEQFRQYAKLLKDAPLPQGKPAEQSARRMFDGAATLHAPRANEPAAQNTVASTPLRSAGNISPQNATRPSPIQTAERISAQGATKPSSIHSAEGISVQHTVGESAPLAENKAPLSKNTLEPLSQEPNKDSRYVYPPEYFKADGQNIGNSLHEPVKETASAVEGISEQSAVAPSALHTEAKEPLSKTAQETLPQEPHGSSHYVYPPEYFKADRRNIGNSLQASEKETGLAVEESVPVENATGMSSLRTEEATLLENAQDLQTRETNNGSRYLYPPEYFKADRQNIGNSLQAPVEENASVAEGISEQNAARPAPLPSVENIQLPNAAEQPVPSAEDKSALSKNTLEPLSQEPHNGSRYVYPSEYFRDDRQNIRNSLHEQGKEIASVAEGISGQNEARPAPLPSVESIPGQNVAEVSALREDKQALQLKNVQEPLSQEPHNGSRYVYPSENIQTDRQNTNIMKTSASEALSGEQETLPLEKPAYRIVGETMNTYILVEQGETLLFIDKHAAHERILFEKFRQSPEPVMPQLMLQPILCTLGGEEAALLLENERFLSDFGFSLSDFGDGVVSVSQIPAELPEDQVEATLSQLAADLQKGKRTEPDDLRDTLLHTLSCKAAIKGGWHSDPKELEALVAQVMSREDLKYCPHGRPICASLTRSQLERQFKRS